jgi:hypothetical protein
MASNSTPRPFGISFLSLLALLFIGLKLTGYINWSWWLVTLPLWGGLIVTFIIVWAVLVYREARK